jgi:hypothetical protein
MNAKEELLRIIANLAPIKCADIQKGYWDPIKIIQLKVGYSQVEYENFLNKLDFEYEDGYGGQELFGIVWLQDGTWMTRGEYDGSEWWEHHQLPVIPTALL